MRHKYERELTETEKTERNIKNARSRLHVFLRDRSRETWKAVGLIGFSGVLLGLPVGGIAGALVGACILAPIQLLISSILDEKKEERLKLELEHLIEKLELIKRITESEKSSGI